MMARGALSVFALCAGLYLAHNIVFACWGLALVWLAVLVLFDLRRGRHFWSAEPAVTTPPGKRMERQWNLLRTALPLGFSTTMAALNLNMPRYFIHTRLGENQLGIYSAMAYATVAMILVSDSLGHSAIPRLSRLYSAGQLKEFRRFLLKMVAAGAALGLSGLAVSQIMGVRLLTLVYGREYSAHYRVFVILILATAIYCVACMFTSAVTSARCFRIQAPLYALIAGSNALACAFWVPSAGLAGGAAAMAVSALVHLTLGIAVVSWLVWSPKKRAALPVEEVRLEAEVLAHVDQ
jgi:O-antigen/teichoic acid export membrane protein